MCLIILFQLYGYRTVLFWSDLICVGQEEELIQYKYNLIQFFSNLSEIIPSKKTGSNYLMDIDVISFFVASKGKKIHKLDKNS